MKLPWEKRLAFTLGLGTAAVPGSDDYLTFTRHGRRLFDAYVPTRVQPAAKMGLRGANFIGGVGKVAFVGQQLYGLRDADHPLNRMASKSSKGWQDAWTHGFSKGFSRSLSEAGMAKYNAPMRPTGEPYVSGGVVYLP